MIILFVCSDRYFQHFFRVGQVTSCHHACCCVLSRRGHLLIQLTKVTNNLRTFIGLFRGQSKGTWHWKDFEWGWTSSCKWRFTECWCWYKSSQWVATMNHIYDTRLFCFFSIVRRLETPTKDFVNFASHAANAHVHMVQSVGLCAWQLKPVN